VVGWHGVGFGDYNGILAGKMGGGFPVKGRDTYYGWWLSCKDEDTCHWPNPTRSGSKGRSCRTAIPPLAQRKFCY